MGPARGRKRLSGLPGGRFFPGAGRWGWRREKIASLELRSSIRCAGIAARQSLLLAILDDIYDLRVQQVPSLSRALKITLHYYRGLLFMSQDRPLVIRLPQNGLD